ncbi:MAG: hypothetical protein ACTHMK_13785 [Dyella sp.]|uniref:hypothetical protein n=1 Tax=Dyella sp. TaxID=1869338 RepID=UPI003F7E695E
MAAADEKLDARILAELAKDPGSLLDLSVRMRETTGVLLPRLQLLGSMKRVQCARDEDSGRLHWQLTDEAAEEIEPATPAPTADAQPAQVPVHVEQPAPMHPARPVATLPATPAPADALSAATLTDRIVAFVADRGLASTKHVIDGFPAANQSSVYSLLSQLVLAGRLVRVRLPGRKESMYRLPEPSEAPAPVPAKTPAPAAAAAPASAPQPQPGSGLVLTMQDADFASLLKIGTVVISNDPKAGVQITIAGFEFGAAGTCRENAARALLWARELVNTALSAQLLVPGGSSRIVVGVD